MPSGHLVTEGPDRFGGRSDPVEVGVDDSLSEVGVLGQEAVAGVNGVSAGLPSRVQDLVEDEVGLRRGVAAEGVGLIALAHVQRVTVGVCVDGYGGDSRVAAGPRHSDGYLAAVRDQDLLHS